MISAPAWIDREGRDAWIDDDQLPADAGEGEDLLDHDHAAEQVADIQRHDRDRRQQRVAQRVLEQHGRGRAGP
jgi:hypothetical protein